MCAAISMKARHCTSTVSFATNIFVINQLKSHTIPIRQAQLREPKLVKHFPLSFLVSDSTETAC